MNFQRASMGSSLSVMQLWAFSARGWLGDFHDWIAAGLGPQVPWRHVDAPTGGALPRASELAGVVLTGSHAMVTERAPWSRALESWLRQMVQAEVPVLGICYGHQLLAQALGGVVDYHPQGMEIGSHPVALTEQARRDPLFSDGPMHFDAHLVHAQSVRRLPAGAVLLAHSRHEPHQAFRIGDRAWGVQFHPEFSAAAMEGSLRIVCAEPGPGRPLVAAPARPTPAASAVLTRFGRLCMAR